MKATFPAWIDGRYVSLSQVLDLIGDNECVWWLDDFEGVTVPGGDLDASQIDERLLRDDRIEFRWEALFAFAEHVHQMVNGRLSARGLDDASAAAFTLEAFDGSEWIIEAREDNAWAVAAMSRITAFVD